MVQIQRRDSMPVLGWSLRTMQPISPFQLQNQGSQNHEAAIGGLQINAVKANASTQAMTIIQPINVPMKSHALRNSITRKWKTNHAIHWQCANRQFNALRQCF